MNVWELRQWWESQWSIEMIVGFSIAVIIAAVLFRWYLDRRYRI